METDYQALMANKPDKDLITYLETPERFVTRRHKSGHSRTAKTWQTIFGTGAGTMGSQL